MIKIPFAHQHELKMKTKGKYKTKWPMGAVVHFTAGRYEKGLDSAKKTIKGGIENGYTFLCIGQDGSVVQAHSVDEWGYHCGKSALVNLLPKNVKPLLGDLSDELIGIEMNNAGKVEPTKDGRYKTWFGTFLEADEVRYVKEKDYGCPTGFYHKYSLEQEAALIKTLLWLKQNDPYNVFNFDYVRGHHEVAGLHEIGRWRKND